MTNYAIEHMINYLVEQRSFALGYPMEAHAIAKRSDYFLTSCLGNTLKMIAIIDCNTPSCKRIIFTEDELNTLRLSLREFSYFAYGKRLDSSIEIWYIGNNASQILKEPHIHLTNVTKYRFWVSSWTFDVKSKAVSCNSLSLRNWLRKRVLSRVFQKTFSVKTTNIKHGVFCAKLDHTRASLSS